MRLRAVLEHPHTQPRGELADGAHVDRLAVQVHGHDADRARRRLAAGVDGVQRVAVVDVDEDGRGVGEADGLDGRERGVRGHEDLVAGLHAERAQREPQRRRGRIRQHAVTHAHVASQLRLERLALGTQNVLARVDGGQHRLLELVVDRWARQRDRTHDLPAAGAEARRPYFPRK